MSHSPGTEPDHSKEDAELSVQVHDRWRRECRPAAKSKALPHGWAPSSLQQFSMDKDIQINLSVFTEIYFRKHKAQTLRLQKIKTVRDLEVHAENELLKCPAAQNCQKIKHSVLERRTFYCSDAFRIRITAYDSTWKWLFLQSLLSSVRKPVSGGYVTCTSNVHGSLWVSSCCSSCMNCLRHAWLFCLLHAHILHKHVSAYHIEKEE